MGTKIYNICGNSCYREQKTEYGFESASLSERIKMSYDTNPKVAKSIDKIQVNWGRYKTLKTQKEELKSTKTQLDAFSAKLKEFVDVSEIEVKTSKKVLEIEKTLPPFELTNAEKKKFSYTFEREPISLKDYSIYHGSWNVNGQKHGFGTLVTKDGSKYIGLWENDCLEGRGRYIDGSGNFVYEGEFSQNKAHGKGQYILPDGMKYIGDWKDDVQEGQGEEIFPDGTRYVGEFKDGEKTGKGNAFFKDGSSYSGDFFNNCIHGKGTYKWADGRIYTGEWVQNKMQGKGKFSWPDRKYYEGEYKNDKKDGFGKYCWGNGNSYEGTWFNGKQHGHGAIFNDKGELQERGIWRYGKMIKKEVKKEGGAASSYEAVSQNGTKKEYNTARSEGLNKENFYSAVSNHELDNFVTNNKDYISNGIDHDKKEVEIIQNDNKSDNNKPVKML